MSETEETDFAQADIDATQRERMSGPPIGIRRADDDGFELIDALAGRASVFGFGFEPITEAIQGAAEAYLGDASAYGDESETHDENAQLKTQFQELMGDSHSIAVDSVFLCASADLAMETAIALARTHRPEKAFRTVAMVGGDHGRTGMCRTASGRPELRAGFGPMMAGFAHVPIGDLDAVRAVVDEQTACILFAPIELRNSARPLDADYLAGLRELCDQHEILLVVDETQLVFGASGRPMTYSAIAEIRADIVVLASGLFAGLPGGVVLASGRVTGHCRIETTGYPMQSAVASETLSSIARLGLPASSSDSMHQFAVTLAEQLSGFEFVRDVHVLGMTIGIEFDIESADIVRAARRRGLRIASAGDTGIFIQPPLVMTDEDQQTMLALLDATMEAIERETAELRI